MKIFKSNPQYGMTLMEVLVALAVFAIVSVTVMASVNNALLRQTDLELKTLALSIADNKMTLLKLQNIWPQNAWQTEQISSENMTWYVRWQGVETQQPLLKALDVEVSDEPFLMDKEPTIRARLRTYVTK